MLVRTDPERHRLSYLSIPRDLRVDIPGHGAGKINAAFALGGPALAMRTITGVTGIEINHIALVDFNSFRELIDELGGVDGERSGADRLQPLRLPVPDRRAVPALAGLALCQGRADDGRAPRADLLAHPREPAEPGRERPHPRRAAAGGGAGDRGQAHEPAARCSSSRSSATSCSSRSPPTSAPASSCSSRG